jgi:hypothetical protein
VHEHGVRPEAAEIGEALDLRRSRGIHALCGMHHERPIRRRGEAARAHVAARLATGADGPGLEQERMRPAVMRDHPDGKPPPDLAVERVVVRHRRDAGKQVLEPANEHPGREGMRAVPAHGGVARQPRPHVVDPRGGVLVALARLQRAVVIQLEVIVCVDQARQHERAAEIHDDVAARGRGVERQHARTESDGRCLVIASGDACVDQRHRAPPRQHLLRLDFTA